MISRKRLLLASLSFAILGTPAMAADLPVEPPIAYQRPPVRLPPRWTGCFIGGSFGGLWARKDWTVAPGDPFFAPGQDFGTHDLSSWPVLGLQAGCDYQAGAWVVGLQGEFGWTNAKGTSVDLLNSARFALEVTDRSRISSLSAVTGRIGYTWDIFIFYVRAGAAWERDTYDIYFTTLGTPLTTTSETRTGWIAGFGAAYGFTRHLSAFLEYNYYGFGTRTNTVLTPAGAVFNYINIKDSKSVVKVGINWTFGNGPGDAIF